MEFEAEKVLIAFNNKTMGEWLKMIQGKSPITIGEPVKLFVQFDFEAAEQVAKANTMNALKEIVATLVFEKLIKNTQQIWGIMVKKTISSKRGVTICISRI